MKPAVFIILVAMLFCAAPAKAQYGVEGYFSMSKEDRAGAKGAVYKRSTLTYGNYYPGTGYYDLEYYDNDVLWNICLVLQYL